MVEGHSFAKVMSVGGAGLPGVELLTMSGITKRYPGALANDHVDLTLEPGEIHALLGENGAGKSTLVKILYGVVRPDSGVIRWRGSDIEIASPNHARSLGIGMVFQHFSLFEGLSVAENLTLGINERSERRALRGRISEVSTRYGLPLDPDRPLSDLSLGERQRVEIVRCLIQSPRLLIMDEPTSVLTPQEADRLFETLRQLAEQGCAILYISHRLEEIRALCVRATIMRQGRVVAHCDPRCESAGRLAELMLGAELAAPSRRANACKGATPRLKLDRLRVRSDRTFGVDLKDVSLQVSAGEILGVAGIAGNGQSELMDALTGETLAERPESVMMDGVAAGRYAPAQRRALGACFVPEERNGHAAAPSMTLSENALLSASVRKRLARFGWIRRRKTKCFAEEIIQGFDVRTAGPGVEARSLSGGNLQKFVVGREVLQDPTLLIVNQPTWGVDAGAAAAIRSALARLAAKGAGILVISQDLDEIFSLCDSIAVLAGGKLSSPRPAAATTTAEIGILMGNPEHVSEPPRQGEGHAL